jgi:hypothetical protein
MPPIAAPSANGHRGEAEDRTEDPLHAEASMDVFSSRWIKRVSTSPEWSERMAAISAAPRASSSSISAGSIV